MWRCVVLVVAILTSEAPSDEEHQQRADGEDDGEPDGWRHLLRTLRRVAKAGVASTHGHTRLIVAAAMTGAKVLWLVTRRVVAAADTIVRATLGLALEGRIPSIGRRIDRLDGRLEGWHPGRPIERLSG